jgi:DNA-binding HxlR family transcriptional regulator
MKIKEIKALLTAVNSTDNFFKYPIGNKDLTEKLKKLESDGIIKFDSLTNRWVQS